LLSFEVSSVITTSDFVKASFAHSVKLPLFSILTRDEEYRLKPADDAVLYLPVSSKRAIQTL